MPAAASSSRGRGHDPQDSAVRAMLAETEAAAMAFETA